MIVTVTVSGRTVGWTVAVTAAIVGGCGGRTVGVGVVAIVRRTGGSRYS